MKSNNKIKGVVFTILACSLLVSCQKKFDPSTYAPEQPVGGYSNSKEIAQGNLVAYWAFNGNLTDSAGNLAGTNHGTTFVNGKKGQALQIGGSNYLLFDNPGTVIPALNSYTVTFWMNAPQNKSYGYGIFSLANNNDFWGNLDIYEDNGSNADSAIFKVHMNNNGVGQFLVLKIGNAWNQWVHMAITYDENSSKFTIYQNGASVYTTTFANYGPLHFTNATKMVIGTWQFQTDPPLNEGANGSSQPWAGSFGGALDEFRIYNKALSASDVNALFKLEGKGR